MDGIVLMKQNKPEGEVQIQVISLICRINSKMGAKTGSDMKDSLNTIANKF